MPTKKNNIQWYLTGGAIFYLVLNSITTLYSTSFTISSLEILQEKDKTYTLQLRYQDTLDDFFIFYDHRGQSIYVKYREDKWDHQTPFKNISLVPGTIYQVNILFIGLSTPVHVKQLISVRNNNNMLNQRILPLSNKEVSSKVLTGKLRKINSYITQQVIY